MDHRHRRDRQHRGQYAGRVAGTDWFIYVSHGAECDCPSNTWVSLGQPATTGEVTEPVIVIAGTNRYVIVSMAGQTYYNRVDLTTGATNGGWTQLI